MIQEINEVMQAYELGAINASEAKQRIMTILEKSDAEEVLSIMDSGWLNDS